MKAGPFDTTSRLCGLFVLIETTFVVFKYKIFQFDMETQPPRPRAFMSLAFSDREKTKSRKGCRVLRHLESIFPPATSVISVSAMRLDDRSSCGVLIKATVYS